MSVGLTSDDLSLLPSNSTAFERELAALSARLDDIDPSVISTIWNAWACPSALLPWLAWALSVDFWDDAWNDVRKRQVIADSPAYHRIKGTRRAVEMAVELVARRAVIVEWFEKIPLGRRGTADVIAEPRPSADLLALAITAKRLASEAKPKSRAIAVSVGLVMDAGTQCSIGFATSAVMRIEPVLKTLPQLAMAVVAQIGHFTQAQMRIDPHILITPRTP